MRIAVLSFDDPWGASHGGTQRTMLFLEALRDLGHEPVCVFAGASEDPVTVARREASGIEFRAANARTLGESRGSGRLGALKRRYLPLPTIRGGSVPALHEALGSAGPFDLLLTQQLRGVPYLDSVPGARLWLDQTDLWSRFLQVEIESLTRLRRLTATGQRLGFVRAERRAARRASALTAAGFGDARRLEQASGAQVTWLPTAVLQVPEMVPRGTVDERPTAGLLANFEYWPNVDAYDVLVQSWLGPLTAAGWRVVVAGYGSERLAAAPGVELMGPVDSPRTFYEAVDVALAPIRLGAGIKVKVLESLFVGRSVFATAAALEGFPPGSVPGAVEISSGVQCFPTRDELPRPDGLVVPETRVRFSRSGFTETVESVLDSLG